MNRHYTNTFAILIILTLLISACELPTLPFQPTPFSPADSSEIPPISPDGTTAEVTFRIQVPTNTPPNQVVLIKIMEEVTGLAFHPLVFEMEPIDPQHYSFKMNIPIGSVIKYRYARNSANAEVQEHVSDGRQVRYRIFHVTGPATVEDVISRWTDTPFLGLSGRINGTVIDLSNNLPLTNILVVAGGIQAITSTDGSFLLEGLPPGTHNLVAYAMDGTYKTFQQGAKVAADSTTPAQLGLTPAPLVSIAFTVKVPPSTIPAVPIRMAGNLYQLGNTYADLAGGVSTVASRMPTLSMLPDGRHTITLALPVGADIRYLFSLGDGLWNAELSAEGRPNIRQLIVPNEDTLVEVEIKSWVTENTAPIVFDITVPGATPPEDFVSIQFKPIYGWTQPIPMWKLGDDRWGFILNSPLNFVDSLHYRYCRNDQCGAADDTQTMGAMSSGYPIQSSLFSQSIKEEIQSWAYLDLGAESVQISTPKINRRGRGFIAGVEFQPIHDPSWSSLYPYIFDDVQKIGGNWIILTPTWSFTRQSPPVFEPVNGIDPLWPDLSKMLQEGNDRGFNLALFPTPNPALDYNKWWSEAARDFSWWQVWFERYRNFILYHADLATQSGSRALVLGGDWLSPSLPGGLLSDNTPSGVPADADTRWRLLIQEIRTHYSGLIFWAITPDQLKNNPPKFLDSIDVLYILWSEPVYSPNEPEPTAAEMEAKASLKFDNMVLPLQLKFNKPIVLGIQYPSANGAASGCLSSTDGQCTEWKYLYQPYPDIPFIETDFQEQVDLYNSMLVVLNQRNWISGFISRGYYPPVILRDKSPSVHGKPVADLLAFWFSEILEEPQQ